MFATNVMGLFLFTELLTERLQQSNAIVVHVIAPFHEDIDTRQDALSIEPRRATGPSQANWGAATTAASPQSHSIRPL